MRTNLLSFILMVFSTIMIAQDATRYPLIEHFTNTRCGICGARNPAFHATWQPYQDQVHHVSVHPSRPYSDCVLYQANTEANMTRTNVYGINRTPLVFLDGSMAGGNGQLITEAQIQNAIAGSSYFNIQVSDNIDAGTTSIEVFTEGTPPSNTYQINALLVERRVEYAAPNGEDVHYNVLRDIAANAEDFTPAANGSSVSFNYTFDVDASWNTEELYVIAFIEDVTAGRIENSGSKFTSGAPSSVLNPTHSYKFFPNPAKEQITFESLVNNVQLSNLNGQLIQSYEGETQNLNIGALPNGFYILKYTNASGEQHTSKLIKN